MVVRGVDGALDVAHLIQLSCFFFYRNRLALCRYCVSRKMCNLWIPTTFVQTLDENNIKVNEPCTDNTCILGVSVQFVRRNDSAT